MPKIIADIDNVCFGIYGKKFVSDIFENGKMTIENWTNSNEVARNIDCDG